VNETAPIICCTAEVLSQMALRLGVDTPFSAVVMDEFHYYADRDRAWRGRSRCSSSRGAVPAHVRRRSATPRRSRRTSWRARVVPRRACPRPCAPCPSSSTTPRRRSTKRCPGSCTARGRPSTSSTSQQRAAAELAQALLSTTSARPRRSRRSPRP
jgi:hypothetical protein